MSALTPDYHGHKTLIDGSHVPLTKDEAAELWKMAEDAKAKRAETMPTAVDALRAMIAAQQRLNELGWWQGGGLRVKRGDECAVAQTGSTGMWTGWLDAEGKYAHFGDSVNSPRDVWLKPLADLTDDERRHMEECDKREAEAASALIRIAEERAEAQRDLYLTRNQRDNLADRAAHAESLAAQALRERDEAREALSQLLRAEYDGPGLRDCTDNDGVAYQSADLAKHIATAETLVGSALSEQPDKERT